MSLSSPSFAAPLSDAPRLDACEAVLFDLDGTLADTAPDLAAAVNKMQRSRGIAQTPLDALRPLASAGARGLIGGAFGIAPADAEFDALRDEFLANYAADLCVHTTLFPGIGALLDDLDARGVRWGIVTNKAARFTDPLVALLGLAARAACVVSGDTASHPKPHPAPLLYAADRLSLAPERIVYVGDDFATSRRAARPACRRSPPRTAIAATAPPPPTGGRSISSRRRTTCSGCCACCAIMLDPLGATWFRQGL